MGLEIKEQDFASFFQAPFNAYGEDSLYVSPLKDDLKRFLSLKNPLFAKYGKRTYFSALRDGRPVGRITAHIHTKSNEKFSEKIGYFGFFDCENNVETARSLLTHAENWLKAEGMNLIRGNFNLTAMQQVGVMVEGFANAPYIDQVYSPQYISTLLEECGYTASFPMTTFELNLSQVDEQSFIKDRHKEVIDNSDFQFAKINFFNTNSVLKQVMQVLNDGFSENPMFVPLTWEEFIFQAKDMMWIMDKHISSLMLHKGRPVGTIVCIPDLNPLLKKVKSQVGLSTPYHFIKHKMNRQRAVIIFYSVCKDFHGMGINPIMLNYVIKNLKQRGYQKCGLTWIADVNPASLRQVEKMKGEVLHRLRLFAKELT